MALSFQREGQCSIAQWPYFLRRPQQYEERHIAPVPLPRSCLVQACMSWIGINVSLSSINELQLCGPSHPHVNEEHGSRRASKTYIKLDSMVP